MTGKRKQDDEPMGSSINWREWFGKIGRKTQDGPQSAHATNSESQDEFVSLKPEESLTESIQRWFSEIFIKAIRSCSTEKDRMDILSWLVLVREIVGDPSLSSSGKAGRIYDSISAKKTVMAILRSIGEVAKNYRDSDLPLPVKIAIPATLAAIAIVGGQGAGIAAFGGAIGISVPILIFIGTAGITAILEAFFKDPGYVGVLLGILAQDEAFRRATKTLQEAMTADIEKPERFHLPEEENALREKLAAMDPYDFERHVMSFFQAHGLLAWVTKKSNDAGVDGFARHPEGLIIVQCKRNDPDNPVGRPDIQKLKGVIEENEAWRGYVVTTSRFTKGAKESASKNDKIVLADMDILASWHLQKFSI